MKALVVRQPWASMIAAGAKRIEVRRRRIHHRGSLLIVAGRRDAAGRVLPRSGAMSGPETLPAGVSVCTVHLVDCRPFTRADEPAAGVAWQPGLWAWELRDPRPTPHIPVRGQQCIFEVDLERDKP